MAGIRGITVTLYEKTRTGTDAFNAPIYEESPTEVEDVLVGQPSTEDITNAEGLYGKKAAYVLGIPKGDAHEWADMRVSFFGQEFRTIGFPVEGIGDNIPLSWNKKVLVERYG